MHARPDLALLAAFLLAAGALSLAAGQDANWDLLNYHLYNPWAWLTGRYAAALDLAPAQLQTFHNPLLDVPFYLMVAAGWRPQVIAVVLALPAGATAWLLWKLAELVFRGLDARTARVAVVASLIVGVTGPNARSMLGTTMNEWPGTALLAGALLLVARELAAGSLQTRTLLVAGLLAGVASGLKLTAAGYAVAFAVALLATRGLGRGMREGSVFSVGVVAGLAATLGPWMVELHRLTGNPLFPYFNSVFPSPWLPPEWSFYKAFGPRSMAQWITLPFDLLRPPVSYVSEQRYRDARFPVLATLALVAIVTPILARAMRRPRPSTPLDRSPGTLAVMRFGAVYLLVSFALWAFLHAIHRYLLALEVLTGIAIVALLVHLVPPRMRTAAVVLLSLAVVATTRVPSWWRVPFGASFVETQAPALPARALVVVVSGPLSYLLPAFPADARFVGVATNLVNLAMDSGIRREAAARIAGHDGPRFVLYVQGVDPAPALAAFGLATAGDCPLVPSNLDRRTPARLCPVVPVRR